MTNEEIKEFITTIQPSATFDETGEWLNITIDPTEWKKLAGSLLFSLIRISDLPSIGFTNTNLPWG